MNPTNKKIRKTTGWGQVLVFMAILISIGVSIANQNWDVMIWQIVALIFFGVGLSHHQRVDRLIHLADLQNDLMQKLVREKGKIQNEPIPSKKQK